MMDRKIEKSNGNHSQSIMQVKRDPRKMDQASSKEPEGKPSTIFLMVIITVVVSACVTLLVLYAWSNFANFPY